MDAWPDFYLEDIPYDWTTFDEVMKRVATDFPAGWRHYHGVKSQEPMLIGETDARELMATASRLIQAAQSLSNRKLPDERRRQPDELEAAAREERRAKEAVRDSLHEMAEAETDPETRAGLEGLISELQGPESMGPKENQHRVFRTFLEIEAFERYGSLPGELADRSLELLGYLVGTDSERARQYLRHVAECYVLDLGPELAVMSRAVLESALETLELEPLVDEVASVTGRNRTLSAWIHAASQAGLLDARAREAAEVVQQAGNAAVHQAPGVEPDTEDILESLVVVLEALEQTGSE